MRKQGRLTATCPIAARPLFRSIPPTSPVATDTISRISTDIGFGGQAVALHHTGRQVPENPAIEMQVYRERTRAPSSEPPNILDVYPGMIQTCPSPPNRSE